MYAERSVFIGTNHNERRARDLLNAYLMFNYKHNNNILRRKKKEVKERKRRFSRRDCELLSFFFSFFFSKECLLPIYCTVRNNSCNAKNLLLPIPCEEIAFYSRLLASRKTLHTKKVLLPPLQSIAAWSGALVIRNSFI